MQPTKSDIDRANIRDFPKAHKIAQDLSAGSTAQITIAIAAILVICYFAKLVLITILTSLLIAFILEPIVGRLERWRVPRSLGSFIAVLLLMAAFAAAIHFSYSKAVEFIDDLPTYAAKIRQSSIGIVRQAQKIEQSTQTVLPDGPGKEPLRVKQDTGWSDWLTSSVSGITELLLTISFIPFLTYFMLSWKERTRASTVKLFRTENRTVANQTLGGIARMLHGFLIGNLICGLFIALASTLAFAFFQIPYFYFIGILSGFLSLVPYLGVVLAMIPPVTAGLGSLDGTKMFTIAAIVIGLHVFAINVLFPKVIGKRLKLNPLVVTIALLVWGWIWGAMGLVLAIPIAGAMKIIFDHIENLRPVGEWMGE